MIRTDLQRAVLPLDALKDADYNPRTITPAAVAGLEASLERFGLVQDIVVNRRTATLGFPPDQLGYVIVGGHQRVNALKVNGAVDTPVTFVDLTPTEEVALNVTLNNELVSGQFNTKKLGDLLDALRSEGADLEAIRLNELCPPIPTDNKVIDEVSFQATKTVCPQCGFKW
jgi:ParB-like chromosome segregation protein Spo0J